MKFRPLILVVLMVASALSPNALASLLLCVHEDGSAHHVEASPPGCCTGHEGSVGHCPQDADASPCSACVDVLLHGDAEPALSPGLQVAPPPLPQAPSAIAAPLPTFALESRFEAGLHRERWPAEGFLRVHVSIPVTVLRI